MSDDLDEILIRCVRCADLPEPGVPANIETCRICDADIWVDPGLLGDIRTVHAGIPIRWQCVDCHGDETNPDNEVDVGLLNTQVDRMRENGLSDMDIALYHAVHVVTGAGSFADTLAEVKANPHGPTAIRVRKVFAEVYTTITGGNN